MLRTVIVSSSILLPLLVSGTAKASESFGPFFYYSFGSSKSDNPEEIPTRPEWATPKPPDFIHPVNQAGFTYLSLEDIENGGAEIPGVTVSTRDLPPSYEVSSFLEDNDIDASGVVLGSPLSGIPSFFEENGIDSSSTLLDSAVTISFSADELGDQLPITAGLLWADSRNLSGGTPLYTGSPSYLTGSFAIPFTDIGRPGMITLYEENQEDFNAVSIHRNDGGITSFQIAFWALPELSVELSEPHPEPTETTEPLEQNPEPVQVPESNNAAVFSLMLLGLGSRGLYRKFCN